MTTRKQKFSTGAATFFLDELFSESTETGYSFAQRKVNQKSPRIYRFNPQQAQRRMAPNAQPEKEIRGRSSTTF